MTTDFKHGLLSEMSRLRNEQWRKARTAGLDAMAEVRAEYAANGWKMCEHPTCPPFDCRLVTVDCANPTHDHDAITDPDGFSDPTSNLCNDCKTPLHYDRTQEWYFHNSMDVPACFLSGPNPVNPCYTYDELAEAKIRCEGEPWPERHADDCLWCKHASNHGAIA